MQNRPGISQMLSGTAPAKEMGHRFLLLFFPLCIELGRNKLDEAFTGLELGKDSIV